MGTALERVGRLELGPRLRAIRVECFGEHGTQALAGKIGLPTRTWDNYECGVTIPGNVLLGFLAVTCAEPMWLMTGDGPRYRAPPAKGPASNWE